jgi:hypothetical protein
MGGYKDDVSSPPPAEIDFPPFAVFVGFCSKLFS